VPKKGWLWGVFGEKGASSCEWNGRLTELKMVIATPGSGTSTKSWKLAKYHVSHHKYVVDSRFVLKLAKILKVDLSVDSTFSI
jgi:hypothetical protein